MNGLRRKLTYANVVASLALFLVLAGGTAFATSQFGKETIGTRALKKEAVTPIKLSQKAKSTLTGPKGATGPQGPPGASGASKFVLREATAVGGTAVECGPGEHLTGGGALDNSNGALKSSFPNAGLNPGESANRWTAQPVNAADSVTVRILCATP